MERTITSEHLQEYKQYLREDEKSAATISKYMHDVTCFLQFLTTQNDIEKPLTKEATLSYKKWLESQYAITSANSMLAAMNGFLKFIGQPQYCVKPFRLQRKAYCPQEQELSRGEYERLLHTAKRMGNHRLCLLLQTICATGIRVSELRYITVESLITGEVQVSCKGKTRVIFLIPALRKKLRGYAKHRNITQGPVFITRSGSPMNRCNIWKEMKSLCAQAGVSKEKVFPHNLRHLFAKCYYKLEKDIVQLADILGHTNVNTTRIYIMSSGVEHRQKMERLRLIT